MGVLSKEQVGSSIIPILVKYCKDPVPNVRFCCVKLLKKLITKVDSTTLSGKIKPILNELIADSDDDTKYYSKQALAIC